MRRRCEHREDVEDRVTVEAARPQDDNEVAGDDDSDDEVNATLPNNNILPPRSDTESPVTAAVTPNEDDTATAMIAIPAVDQRRLVPPERCVQWFNNSTGLLTIS